MFLLSFFMSSSSISAFFIVLLNCLYALDCVELDDFVVSHCCCSQKLRFTVSSACLVIWRCWRAESSWPGHNRTAVFSKSSQQHVKTKLNYIKFSAPFLKPRILTPIDINQGAPAFQVPQTTTRGWSQNEAVGALTSMLPVHLWLLCSAQQLT